MVSGERRLLLSKSDQIIILKINSPGLPEKHVVKAQISKSKPSNKQAYKPKYQPQSV